MGAGALVGHAINTSIYNCHIAGGTLNAPGQSNTGGLVGSYDANNDVPFVEVSGCSSSVDVIAKNYGGGLIGTIRSNVANTGGGIVYIRNCFASGDVLSGGNTGGLIGYMNRSKAVTIDHCYASGNLTSTSGKNIGGIVGQVDYAVGASQLHRCEITYCAALNNTITVSAGSVADTGTIHRIIGTGVGMLEYGTLFLHDNYGLDTMSLDGTYLIGENSAGVDGANKSREDFSVKSIWETSDWDFSDGSYWKWDNTNNKPVLTGILGTYDIWISNQPKDTKAYKNKPAKFYIESTRGVEKHSYQWQISSNKES